MVSEPRQGSFNMQTCLTSHIDFIFADYIRIIYWLPIERQMHIWMFICGFLLVNNTNYMYNGFWPGAMAIFDKVKLKSSWHKNSSFISKLMNTTICIVT